MEHVDTLILTRQSVLNTLDEMPFDLLQIYIHSEYTVKTSYYCIQGILYKGKCCNPDANNI